MGRNINSSKLTKQLILSKVSQVTIFSTYLNLSDKLVQYCIDTGELICSPIRDDVHPTCGFRYDNKGKLIKKTFHIREFIILERLRFLKNNLYKIQIISTIKHNKNPVLESVK